MTESIKEQTQLIVDWIKTLNDGMRDVDLDEDLFDSGLVSSLKFMQLVLLIERVTGQEVDMDSIELEQFSSVNAIVDNFLLPTPALNNVV
ncbi:acyl carrier protein [Agrobacterium burrii]|uniref:Acyl carrier protein n=1 Tax=Agrobacterium burrii TaxID=2815339 RepID=A0ABS3EQM5_9HYPH|nr:acyl carrier protein [Agrobacterium burrii]MBO0134260.1 acyl carrier protein [Agrobacterium burrii]